MVFLDSKSTVLILGATGTLGEPITREIAKTGCRIIIASRNPAKATALVNSLARAGNKNVEIEAVDLSDLKSVYEFGTRVRKSAPKLHALVNCATAVTFSATATVDGYEMNWVVNSLVPLYISILLKPSLAAAGTATKKARIVNLVSKVTMCAKVHQIDLAYVLNPREFYRFSPLNCFLVSKIESRMLTYTLAENFAAAGVPISVLCCHPGYVTSTSLKHLGFGKGIDTIEKSIATPLQVVLSDKFEGVSGKYVEDEKITDCYYHKDPIRDEVWETCTARLNTFTASMNQSGTGKSTIPYPFPSSAKPSATTASTSTNSVSIPLASGTGASASAGAEAAATNSSQIHVSTTQ